MECEKNLNAVFQEVGHHVTAATDEDEVVARDDFLDHVKGFAYGAKALTLKT